MAAANMVAKISNSLSQCWKEEGHTGNDLQQLLLSLLSLNQFEIKRAGRTGPCTLLQVAVKGCKDVRE